jgi:SAM-dependent methyltransferase
VTAQQTVLFVSSTAPNCGVYQFGRRIGDSLKQSQAFDFRYCECGNPDDLVQAIATNRPSLIIYNHHSATLPWVQPELTRKFSIPQIGMIHEVTQEVADRADNQLFDFHIAPDPTLLLKNPLVFKTGRLVRAYRNVFPLPDCPTIGSFGFGTDGKGLEPMIAVVQESYDVARIRLHLPPARYGDSDGARARAIVARCEALIDKPGITLETTHEFLDEPLLLDFLAQNTCNAFFYNQGDGRGISSVVDYALSVGRPIAIRRTSMMRHLWNAMPSICIEQRSLPEIIASGTRPQDPFTEQWCEANLVWDYERIVRKALEAYRPRAANPSGLLRRAIRSIKRRQIKLSAPTPASHCWANDTTLTVDTSTWKAPETYRPVHLGAGQRYNRVLGNADRQLYRAAIAKLFVWLPDLMSRKIPEANVQQAFALDTIVRLAPPADQQPRILCVGSFEDSAAWGMRRIGYRIDEVDPVMNFDLNDFLQRPTTQLGSYDVVFTVSVIEHVADDESFARQLAELLKPGGFIILTCDFLDSYLPGDPKPQADFRLYTARDLRKRLLPQMEGCALVGESCWELAQPDFSWEGCRYSFATFVAQKRT